MRAQLPPSLPYEAQRTYGGEQQRGGVPAYLLGGGKLRVLVQHAVNLAGKDSNGFSDPYVKLDLGETHKKTKHRSKTLDPTWNEVVEFETTELRRTLEQPLRLQVVNYNTFTKGDDLGSAELDLRGLASVCPEELPRSALQTPHVVVGGETLYDGFHVRFEQVALHYSSGGGQGAVTLSVQMLPEGFGALGMGGHKGLDEAKKKLAKELSAKARVEFDGAGDESLREVAQAWSVRHSAEATARHNLDYLRAVAAALHASPSLFCRVHYETAVARRGPARLADALRMRADRDVDALMDHLAEQRALACLEALVELGVDEHRLYATHKGQGDGEGARFELQAEPPPREEELVGGAGRSDPRRPLAPTTNLVGGVVGGSPPSGKRSVDELRAAELRTSSADQIGIGVGGFEPHASALNDGGAKAYEAVVEMPFLSEHPLATGRCLASGRPPLADFRFYQTFEVPPASTRHAQLLDLVRRDLAKGSAAAATNLTFTVWAVDEVSRKREEVGAATLPLTSLLARRTDLRHFPLELHGRHSYHAGTLHVTVVALGVIQAAALATDAERPPPAGAYGAAGPQPQPQPQPSPKPKRPPPTKRGGSAEQAPPYHDPLHAPYHDPLHAPAVPAAASWGMEQERALKLLQRFARERHNRRKRGLLPRGSRRHGRAASASKTAAAAAADLASRAALGDALDEKQRAEELLRPPAPIRRQLETQQAAIVRMQSALRAALARRRHGPRRRERRGAAAGGGAARVLDDVSDAEMQRIWGLDDVGGVAMALRSGGGRQQQAPSKDRVAAWSAWLADERRATSSRSLLSLDRSVLGGEADPLDESTAVHVRLLLALPPLPVAAAYRLERIENAIGDELAALLSIERRRLQPRCEEGRPIPAGPPRAAASRAASSRAAPSQSKASRVAPSHEAAEAPAGQAPATLLLTIQPYVAAANARPTPQPSPIGAAHLLAALVSDPASPLHRGRWLCHVIARRPSWVSPAKAKKLALRRAATSSRVPAKAHR